VVHHYGRKEGKRTMQETHAYDMIYERRPEKPLSRPILNHREHLSTLLEMAADIVSSHASASKLSTDELLLEIQKAYASRQALEAGKGKEIVSATGETI
jgi:hypothetical protein